MTNMQDFEQRLNQLQADFEELKKGENKRKRWIPSVGARYSYIDNYGYISYNYWEERTCDNWRLFQNNVFRTEAEAQHHLECLKTKGELRALAEELNGDEELDWDNGEQPKYGIYYSTRSREIKETNIYCAMNIGTIACLDPRFLDKAIERIGEQRLKDMILEGV